MPPSTSGTEEITFQLTDAQFSVIALAAPGKPSVVIDRIAYTPYGEPTRRLRSDVDGNGVVDSRDYEDVIQQLIGTPITSPTYRVEADLDRNGAITLADYDICIADDGRKILGGGGVGETDLFSPGVRNSVGYCGYIHNEDTGLYTVRFRTYSPTLGRWLTRDPAGYVDGLNLFAYCKAAPTAWLDPLGLKPAGDAHPIPLCIGGSPRQLGFWLDEDMHTRQHRCLARELNDGIENWDKMREKFARLTGEERASLIKKSLIEAGVDPKHLTDDVMKGIFHDFQANKNRSSFRCRIANVMMPNGSMKRGSVFLVFVVAVASGANVANADQLTDIPDIRACEELARAIQRATPPPGSACKRLNCSILDGAMQDAMLCADGLAVAIKGAGAGDLVALKAWHSVADSWQEVRDKCHRSWQAGGKCDR